MTPLDTKLTIAFGPVDLQFMAPESCLTLLRRRYARFVVSSPRGSSHPAPFPIGWKLQGDLPAAVPEAMAVVRESVRYPPHRDGVRLQGESFQAVIRGSNHPSEAQLSAPAGLYAVDHLLEYLLPRLWIHGPLLHAAALLDEAGRAWIASGPSGIGKSTLAKLCGTRAVADEVVAIDLRPETPQIHSLPYSAARPASAPLAGVHLLRQSPQHRLSPLSATQAMRQLAPETLWPQGDRPATARLFDQLGDLADRVPAWELAFAPTADVWPILSSARRVA